MSDNLDWIRRQLCDQSFQSFGTSWICYVKRTVQDGRGEYQIYGADGTYLECYPDRATADAAASQYELEALSVH